MQETLSELLREVRENLQKAMCKMVVAWVATAADFVGIDVFNGGLPIKNHAKNEVKWWFTNQKPFQKWGKI